MISWFADENFNADILAGVRRRVVGFEVKSVEGERMRGATDPQVLEFAAERDMVLLTHDEQTMPLFAYERLQEGLPMPGVVVVPWTLALRPAIDAIELLVEAGQPSDFADKVRRLPF